MELDQAEKLYDEALETTPLEMKAYILNNKGINHFYQFVDFSSSLAKDKEGQADPGKPQMIDELMAKGIDKVQMLVKHLDGTINSLKDSVRVLENFDVRYKSLESIHSDTVAYPEAHQPELKKVTSVEQLNEKLFVDEFFQPKTVRDFLPKDFKQYDVRKHAYNEKFLKSVITRPDSILPIQNLGELAYILQRYKEAFAFLDMSLKLYKMVDTDNLLKFKCLSLLGSLLEAQGDSESMRKINQTIFKSLEVRSKLI